MDSLRSKIELPTGKRISFFLSHSSADKPLVRRFGNDLMHYDARVWIDEAEIKVGESLIEKISEGLYDTDYVVAFLSKHSVQSEWVKRELNFAITREINGKRVGVLPVRLDNSEIPAFLLDKKYADFRSSSKYLDSMRQFAREVGLVERGAEIKFLRQFVFFDMIKRNEHFDVEVIDHFFKSDFARAVTRLEFFGIKIQGVEAFSIDGMFLDVAVCEMNEGDWVRAWLQQWPDDESVVFSASYDIPDRVIELFIGP